MLFSNQYLATVRDESHQITKRLVNASNLQSAVVRLQREKFLVISVEQRRNPTLEALKNGKLEFGSPASARELATFSNNLALMGLVLHKFANVVTCSNPTRCVLYKRLTRAVVLYEMMFIPFRVYWFRKCLHIF